jgi:SPP1 family holin
MKISKGTIVRTIVLGIVLINMVLANMGKSPIQYDETGIANVIGTLVSLAAIITAWWKNNSFTEAAKKADTFMQALKNSDGTASDGE